MPLRVRIETERGERVGDTRGFWPPLNDILPPYDDLTYHCLRFIDPYCHTIFNHRQMDRLIEELERRRREVSRPEYDPVFDQVLDLARECRRHYHHYPKFVGD